MYGKREQKLPDGMINLEPHLREASEQPLPSDFRNEIKKGVKPGHSALYIFTSGTTGLCAKSGLAQQDYYYNSAPQSKNAVCAF